MRDTARTILMADIAHARTSLSARGVADRIGGRIGDGAKDVFEVAKTHSDDNRGIIAALIGAVLLWLAREPILEILGLSQDAENLGDEPADEPETGHSEDGNENAANAANETQSEDISAKAEPLPPGDDDEQ
jgi:hypothetical protein